MVRFTGDWDKALELSARAKAAVAKTLEAEADGLAEKLREGLASGSPAGTTLAPLHPVTAALKGSQVPLAGMERWVAVRKEGAHRYFIGFLDPEGVRIGTIHEEGRSWTAVWTARQRAWFFATLSRLGMLDRNRERREPSDGLVRSTIPARPWLGPVKDAYLPGAQKRVSDAVVRAVLR